MTDPTFLIKPQMGCNPRIGELKPPAVPDKVTPYAHGTNDPQRGESRLDSGGFRAERGHGFRDGNKGLVFPVQRELRRIKLYNHKPDGKFGSDTEKAVTDFQNKYNEHFGLKEGDKDYLPVTGKVDYYTWEVLKHWNPQCKEETKDKPKVESADRPKPVTYRSAAPVSQGQPPTPSPQVEPPKAIKKANAGLAPAPSNARAEEGKSAKPERQEPGAAKVPEPSSPAPLPNTAKQTTPEAGKEPNKKRAEDRSDRGSPSISDKPPLANTELELAKRTTERKQAERQSPPTSSGAPETVVPSAIPPAKPEEKEQQAGGDKKVPGSEVAQPAPPQTSGAEEKRNPVEDESTTKLGVGQINPLQSLRKQLEPWVRHGVNAVKRTSLPPLENTELGMIERSAGRAAAEADKARKEALERFELQKDVGGKGTTEEDDKRRQAEQVKALQSLRRQFEPLVKRGFDELKSAILPPPENTELGLAKRWAGRAEAEAEKRAKQAEAGKQPTIVLPPLENTELGMIERWAGRAAAEAEHARKEAVHRHELQKVVPETQTVKDTLRPLTEASKIDPKYLKEDINFLDQNSWAYEADFAKGTSLYFIYDGGSWFGDNSAPNTNSRGQSRRMVLGSYGPEVASVQVMLNHIPGVTPVTPNGKAGEDTMWAIRHYNRWLLEIGTPEWQTKGDYLYSTVILGSNADGIAEERSQGLESIRSVEAGQRARAYIEQQKAQGVQIKQENPGDFIDATKIPELIERTNDLLGEDKQR